MGNSQPTASYDQNHMLNLYLKRSQDPLDKDIERVNTLPTSGEPCIPRTLNQTPTGNGETSSKPPKATEKEAPGLEKGDPNDGVTLEEFTLSLPYELSEKILQYLGPLDLCRFQGVCVQYREVGNSDKLWLHFCLVRGWLRFGVKESILREQPLYTKETNVSGNSPLFELYEPEDTRLSQICLWKNVFIRMSHLSNNWAKGRYTVSPILRGHTEKVTAMDSEGYTLVSGGADKQLRVWDIRSGECLRTMRGHTDTVSAVKLKGHFVITGCGDSTIRVYDLKTGKVSLTFQGHAGSVDHVELYEGRVISAATDKCIRIWDLREKVLLHTLRGHDDDIECVSVDHGIILSGSWDKTLIVWKLDTGRIIHRLTGHTEAVTAAQFDEGKVVSGSADGDVRIWSLQTGECTHTLTEPDPASSDMEVYCVVYNREVIAAGYSDSVVRVWGFDGSLKQHLREHLGVVRCLHISPQRLVSGGDQKKIVVWDYRTGKKLNVAHRNPSRLQQMLVTETRIITASPDTPGTLTVLSYW